MNEMSRRSSMVDPNLKVSADLLAKIEDAAEESGLAGDDYSEYKSIEDARSSITTLETCGIDGDWGQILDPDWVKALPESLRSEWEAMDPEDEQDKWESYAVGSAKSVCAEDCIRHAEEWIEKQDPKED